MDLFDRRTRKVLQHIALPTDLPGVDPNPELHITFLEDHAGVLWMTFSYGYGLARVNRESAHLDVLFSGWHGKRQHASGRSPRHCGDSGRCAVDRHNVKRHPEAEPRADAVRCGIGIMQPTPNSLSGDQVHGLFLDREGNMWAGTNGAGVNRFSPRPSPFKVYQHIVGDPNSLDMNYTTSILRGQPWSALDREP